MELCPPLIHTCRPQNNYPRYHIHTRAVSRRSI
nr:MAG TPA: hypothetical protein [Caudoviricetes sp.]